MTMWLHMRALVNELERKRPWPADGDVKEPWFELSESEMNSVKQSLREAAEALESLGYTS